MGNLKLLFNHKAQRHASLAQGILDVTAQLNMTAHRTKPAFALFSEPRGFSHHSVPTCEQTHMQKDREDTARLKDCNSLRYIKKF